MRDLGRGIDDELVAAIVPVGEHGFAFHRHHGLTRKRDLAPDHDWRAFGLCLEAALVVEREKDVVLPLLVDTDRRLHPRCLRIDEDRQLVEFDVDLFAEILGLGPRRGDAHCDGFAHEAHLLVRQRVPLGQFVARHGCGCDDRCDIAQIGADENLVFGAGGLDDAPDAAMRNGAAEKGNLALPRKDHIRNEVATTVQMAGVLLALDPGSDPLRHA